MDTWKREGGGGTGPEPTVGLSCLPGSIHASPSGTQPHPQQELLPTVPPLERGLPAGPRGRMAPYSPGTGVRRETETPVMPGRGGDDHGQQGMDGIGLKEE